VDAQGELTLQNGEHFIFTDGVDLAYQLAASPQVKQCYVHQWLNYAVGYQVPPTHQVLLDLSTQFQEQDQVKTLLIHIVQSDLFRFLKHESTSSSSSSSTDPSLEGDSL
jgi:hypothetical protein